ncbi:MAG: DUF1697 domain-containing protein [Candidatus Sulfotelmatobacter sp.]
MPVYVALLRGINLGPHKRMHMERLRESFSAAGCEQVQTYIQSGNVVFATPRVAPAALCQKLEERILRDFGFPAPVVARTREEMTKVMKKNPFLKKPGADGAKLHVIFLAQPPAAEALQALQGLTTLPDESRCMGREIYLYLPNGMGKSSLMNNAVERRWLKGATTRNWNTVTKLYEMCESCQ